MSIPFSLKKQLKKKKSKRLGQMNRLHKKRNEKGRKRTGKRKQPMMQDCTHSNEMYNSGYNQGYDKGHDTGYQKGSYDGGDGIVDRLIPEAHVLPGIPIEQIIARGLESLRDNYVKVITTEEAVQLIIHALNTNRPLSLVRLGDGELLTMSQDTLKSREEIAQSGKFLEYAGVKIPDIGARDQLVHSVKKATVVGIPLLRVPNYQNLAFEVFRAYGMHYNHMKLTHSTINYAIYLEHRLSDILTGRRVLIVGNKAEELAEVFTAAGVSVTGAIAPVSGMGDIDRVMEEVSRYQFDIAIVSAGIPSVVIAQRIASELGKVAIDFGHLADSMVNGETPYH